MGGIETVSGEMEAWEVLGLFQVMWKHALDIGTVKESHQVRWKRRVWHWDSTAHHHLICISDNHLYRIFKWKCAICDKSATYHQLTSNPCLSKSFVDQHSLLVTRHGARTPASITKINQIFTPY